MFDLSLRLSVRPEPGRKVVRMISLLIFSLLLCHQPAHSAPLHHPQPSGSNMELLSRELNPVEETENKEETEDSDWLARIVPEFSLSELFQPLQLQIPVLTLPGLPSYTIALS